MFGMPAGVDVKTEQQNQAGVRFADWPRQSNYSQTYDEGRPKH